jgi:hypothetical protein
VLTSVDLGRMAANLRLAGNAHQRVDEYVGLEATSENQSWIAVEAPTVRNPGSSFASHRRHRREWPIHETLT